MTSTDIATLQEALQTIRSECNLHRGSRAGYSPSCSSCPLSSDGRVCGILGVDVDYDENWRKAPCEWKLLYDVRLFVPKEKK